MLLYSVLEIRFDSSPDNWKLPYAIHICIFNATSIIMPPYCNEMLPYSVLEIHFDSSPVN